MTSLAIPLSPDASKSARLLHVVGYVLIGTNVAEAEKLLSK